jgi:hypothetical protein
MKYGNWGLSLLLLILAWGEPASCQDWTTFKYQNGLTTSLNTAAGREALNALGVQIHALANGSFRTAPGADKPINLDVFNTAISGPALSQLPNVISPANKAAINNFNGFKSVFDQPFQDLSTPGTPAFADMNGSLGTLATKVAADATSFNGTDAQANQQNNQQRGQGEQSGQNGGQNNQRTQAQTAQDEKKAKEREKAEALAQVVQQERIRQALQNAYNNPNNKAGGAGGGSGGGGSGGGGSGGGGSGGGSGGGGSGGSSGGGGGGPGASLGMLDTAKGLLNAFNPASEGTGATDLVPDPKDPEDPAKAVDFTTANPVNISNGIKGLPTEGNSSRSLASLEPKGAQTLYLDDKRTTPNALPPSSALGAAQAGQAAAAGGGANGGGGGYGGGPGAQNSGANASANGGDPYKGNGIYPQDKAVTFKLEKGDGVFGASGGSGGGEEEKEGEGSGDEKALATESGAAAQASSDQRVQFMPQAKGLGGKGEKSFLMDYVGVLHTVCKTRKAPQVGMCYRLPQPKKDMGPMQARISG